MAQEFQDDFEDSPDSNNDMMENSLKENLLTSEFNDSPDIYRNRNELLVPNESNEFIEYYLTRMNDVNNELIHNSKNKQPIPIETFSFLDKLISEAFDAFNNNEGEIFTLFEKLVVDLNNSATDYMAFRNFENAKKILFFCIDKLNTNNDIFECTHINENNPSLLINSYNNLGTCFIKQYKENPKKFKKNLNNDNALRY